MSQVRPPLARPFVRNVTLLLLLVGALAALLAAGRPVPGRMMPAARLGGSGYWLAGSGGGVYAFGAAQDFGGISNPPAPIATLAGTSSGKGYWLTTTTGEVFARGDAVAHGGMGGTPLNKPIVGMAPTPTGAGYWLVASDGGVFAFGDAAFFGSMGGKPLNKPIVGMTPSASGKGYWFVASDGGLFAFGDAGFFGSMGDKVLNKPVVGMAASRTGRGYRMVAADGGIFSFGDAGFYGSTGDRVLNLPIRSMAATPSGNGYWFVASDGGVFAFGDAAFSGAAVGRGQTIVGMAAANALPRTAADTVGTDEDVAATIDVLANDQNLTDTPISLAVESGPSAGTASVEAGRIVYRPNPDANGTDAFVYRVTDGDGDTATGRVSLTVRPINDAPEISTFGTAGGASSSLDIDEDSQGGVGFSVGDRESAAGSLTTTASSNNQQVLPNAGITMTGSGDDRTMTLRPAANQHGTAIITVTVSDGQASSSRTFTVNVRAVNDFPTMASFPSSKTIDEDSDTGELDFSVGDSETAASALAVTATSDNGSLVGSSGLVITKGSAGHRILTVSPRPNASGTARITATVSDGELTASRSFILVVNPVNDSPVAGDVSVGTDEDQPLSGTVAASDVDDTTLSFSLATDGAPTHGALTLAADGSYTYTPAENYNGPDSFTVKVDDGRGGSDTGVVSVTVDPVNDAPVATDLSVTTDEDVDTAGYLNSGSTKSITDVDDFSSFCELQTGPTNGTATVIGNCYFSYSPAAQWSGSDSFTVLVSDGAGATDTMTIFVTVNGVNDLPVVTGGILAATEDQAAPVSGQVVASDVESATLSYAAGAAAAKGDVTVNAATGAVTYLPDADQFGADSFTVIVTDGDGGSATATFTVDIAPVSDPPVASDTALITDEDTPGSVTVAASDPDGETLSFTLDAAPTRGSVELDAETGEATYTPAPNSFGLDSFTVLVTDEHGDTDTATVAVTVNAVNDEPVAAGAALSATEDQPGDSEGAVSATDVELDTLTFALGTPAAKGTATVDPATGAIRYRPSADANGADTFTVTVSDGNGGTDTATVTVTIETVNDTPQAVGDVTDTDEDVPVTIAVLANDTGTGDRPVAVTISTAPTSGTAVVNADNTVTYTPDANWSGVVGFDYSVRDLDGESDAAHVTVDVAALNDAPVAHSASVSTNEDTSANGSLSATDVENSPLTYSRVTAPAHGDATVSSNGFFTYTPDADWHGTDSFTFTVNDGAQDSAPATVTITVSARNDAPVAAADLEITDEDTAVVIAVLDNDSGLGDGVASVEITSDPDPTSGTIAVGTDNSVTYTPAANWNGTTSFTYRVTDTDGQWSSATVLVTVTAVNDAPTLAPIPNVAINEDTASSAISLTVGDVDTASAGLTLSGSADPVLVDPSGFEFSGTGTSRTLVITPKANASGTADVTITVSDGSATATRTFTLTVNAVNDAPTAAAQSFDATEETAFSGALTGTDVDGDVPTFALAAQAANGSVTVRADGTFDYLPKPNFAGTDTFTFTVSDGQATSTPVTATMNVANVNDAPVAGNDAVDLSVLGSASFNLLSNDSDPDTGDSPTVTLLTTPAHGVLACTNGQCTITLGVAGDGFTYQLSDASDATSNTATVTFE